MHVIDVKIMWVSILQKVQIGAKEAIEARVWRAKYVRMQLQVSNYENFKLDTCSWTPT